MGERRGGCEDVVCGEKGDLCKGHRAGEEACERGGPDDRVEDPRRTGPAKICEEGKGEVSRVGDIGVCSKPLTKQRYHSPPATFKNHSCRPALEWSRSGPRTFRHRHFEPTYSTQL